MDNFRIPELPLLQTVRRGQMLVVYDPRTDVTYRVDLITLQATSGGGGGGVQEWVAGTNYPIGADVKEFDPVARIYRAFTRTEEPLPGAAPYPAPTTDTAKLYYIPWQGSGGGSEAPRVHSSVFSKHFN